jgi:hypothetical protein
LVLLLKGDGVDAAIQGDRGDLVAELTPVAAELGEVGVCPR